MRHVVPDRKLLYRKYWHAFDIQYDWINRLNNLFCSGLQRNGLAIRDGAPRSCFKVRKTLL